MSSAKWWPFCSGLSVLTHKQLEMHGCKFRTFATDAMVLKHQAISTHTADYIFIVLEQFHVKYHGYSEQYYWIKSFFERAT